MKLHSSVLVLFFRCFFAIILRLISGSVPQDLECGRKKRQARPQAAASHWKGSLKSSVLVDVVSQTQKLDINDVCSNAGILAQRLL